MSVELGSGYLSIIPETKGFASALSGGLSAPMAGVGRSMGGIFSGGLSKAIMTAAPIAAVLAIGGAGMAAAGTMKSAFNIIRTETGATGARFTSLKADMTNVFTSIPGTAEDAGKAIAGLNARLGLTGFPLRTLAKQVLELSRITKTDLGTNIQAVSRVFGAWSIKGKAMAPTLDKLYRASQQTGIGVGELAQNMVQYGPLLRMMGYSFDESAAMLGKFEKTGADSGKILAGLKMGFGRLAKAGKDPRAEIDKLAKAIDTAGMTAANKQKVFEMFGARGGVAMADAFEKGRFKLGDLTKSIATGSDTIMKAAEDTKGWAATFDQLTNVGTVVLAPIGRAIYGVINPALKGVTAVASGFVSALEGGATPIEAISQALGENFGAGVADTFNAIADAISPITDLAGPLKAAFTTGFADVVGKIATNLGLIDENTGKVKVSIGNLTKSAGWKDFTADMKDFGGDLGSLGTGLGKFVDGIVKLSDAFRGIQTGAGGGLAVLKPWADAIREFQSPINQLAVAANILGDIFKDVMEFMGPGAVQAIVGFAEAVAGTVELVSPFTLIVTMLTGDRGPIKVFNEIGASASRMFSGIGQALMGLVGVVGNAAGRLWKWLVGTWQRIYNALIGKSIIPDLVRGIISWIGRLPGQIAGLAGSMAAGFIARIVSLKDRAVATVRGLVSSIVATVRSLPTSFAQVVSDLMNRFIGGIRAGIGRIATAGRQLASALIKAVKDFLGIHSKSSVFTWMAKMVTSGFIHGLNFSNAMSIIKRFFGGVWGLVGSVPSMFAGLMGQGKRGGGMMGLRPFFSAELAGLMAAVRALGGHLSITDGFRTWAQQVALYAAKPGLAARPGHSKHQLGLAADLAGSLGLAHMLARLFGLYFPMSYEPWHIQPVGYVAGGVSSGPQTGYPVILHGTEGIFTAQQMRYLAPTSSGTVVNITADSLSDARKLADIVARVVRQKTGQEISVGELKALVGAY